MYDDYAASSSSSYPSNRTATTTSISLNDYYNQGVISTTTYPYHDYITKTTPVIHSHGDVVIDGDLELGGKITIPHGEIGKATLDEDDVIMLTFDIEQYDVAECQQILEMWQRNFPNHKVIATFKGVKVDFIKDKGRKNNEVAW